MPRPRVSSLAALLVGALVSTVSAARAADASPASYKFAFGSGPAPAGYTQVSPDTKYTDKLGYGFDAGMPGLNGQSTTPAAKLTAEPGAVTSDKAFYFSVAVPEGNYRVTATFGSAQAASNNTVKAELRRLMVNGVHTDAGQQANATFTVNVRTPDYPGGSVKLKAPRESIQEGWDWDKRLTLEFIGDHPSLATLQIEKVNVPTVFIVGDSTSCDQLTEPFNSWGQSITCFFKPDVAVSNHGESGETTADSLGRHRFNKVWSLMKPGDYLFVQFGHNDMKSPGTLESYTAALQKVVDGTKKTGGTLVIVTPVSRHSFDDSGNVTNSLQGYPRAAYEVAEKNHVSWIELNAMSKTLYEFYGKDGSEALFANTGPGKYDGTHHSDFGSYEIAKCVILGIQQNKLPLATSIVEGFQFDPAHPDAAAAFTVPADPVASKGDKPPGS